MSERACVDTSVLVYRYDPSEPAKQARAAEFLRRGVEDGSLLVPYQSLLEFVAATTRPRGARPPLLPKRDAWREASELADVFEVLYPGADVLPAAIALTAVHGLPWYDAVMLAYAETRGLGVLWSEDFENGRSYGRVRVVNPFV